VVVAPRESYRLRDLPVHVAPAAAPPDVHEWTIRNRPAEASR
jgi:hypothetical protein